MADPAQQLVAPADDVPTPGDQQQPGELGDPGGYPTTPGIRWVPLYPSNGSCAESVALTEAKRGYKHGLIGAGVVLIATAVLAVVYRDAGAIGTSIGVGGAVAAGVFMVAAGMGMLTGEALQAVEVPVPAIEISIDEDRRLPLVDWAKPIDSARQGLQGLTTARAAIFAGALLLAVAAIGGGISTAGSADPSDGAAPSTSTGPSPSAEPASTNTP